MVFAIWSPGYDSQVTVTNRTQFKIHNKGTDHSIVHEYSRTSWDLFERLKWEKSQSQNTGKSQNEGHTPPATRSTASAPSLRTSKRKRKTSKAPEKVPARRATRQQRIPLAGARASTNIAQMKTARCDSFWIVFLGGTRAAASARRGDSILVSIVTT